MQLQFSVDGERFTEKKIIGGGERRLDKEDQMR